MPTPQSVCLLLNRVPGLGSTQLTKLRRAFGSFEALVRAGVPQLQQAGLSPSMAARVVQGLRDEAWVEQELERARRGGIAVLTWADAAYPSVLKTIPDPPVVLYLRGALAEPDAIAVAFVGSRYASLYGLQSAERLAAAAAEQGITVVSGLARGIDAAAHEGALKAGGRTIAVLGSGLGDLYPPEHEPLAERIAHNGAVISEYPMDTAPLPINFPRRNRLISGLSLGVVVVEAAARSGALITADCALEQGREVFAVPGPMTSRTSQGTHGLLKQGARLVTSVEDLLEELHLTSRPVLATMSPQRQASSGPASASQQRLLACLSQRQPEPLEAVIARSGLPRADVMVALLELQVRRMIRQLPGQRFIRC